MASQLPNPPPGFDDLPVGDQIAYVGALWDRITAREQDVHVPAAHRVELERRLAEHATSAEPLRSWSEVEADLRTDLAQRRTQ